MRRAFVVVAGLALAIPAALLVLPFALLFGSAAAHSASWRLSGVADLLIGLGWSDNPAGLVRAALKAAAQALAITCSAPVICAALIGEATGLVSWLWYVGATAAFSLVLPLAAMEGLSGLRAPSDAGALAPLLVTGAIAGFVYWVVAAPPGLAAARRDHRLPVGFEQRPGGS